MEAQLGAKLPGFKFNSQPLASCMTVDKFMVCVKDKRSLTGARAWVMGWGEVGTEERNLCPQSRR